jgi:acyl-CoA thioester hydrolase
MKFDCGSTTTPFSWPIRVYWEDTDAGGIVFYANYLKFFERARTEWLRALGLEQRVLQETTGCIFVVSEANIKYLRPARLDDQMLVTAQLSEMGRSSFTILQEARLLAQPDGASPLLCSGSVRIGWISHQTMKPARIPPQIQNALQRRTNGQTQVSKNPHAR